MDENKIKIAYLLGVKIGRSRYAAYGRAYFIEPKSVDGEFDCPFIYDGFMCQETMGNGYCFCHKKKELDDNFELCPLPTLKEVKQIISEPKILKEIEEALKKYENDKSNPAT